jgi:hypothetical protein
MIQTEISRLQFLYQSIETLMNKSTTATNEEGDASTIGGSIMDES